jgi:hypothetical protein
MSMMGPDLETGAEAEDHVRLLSRPARPVPVDGPGDGAALPEMNNRVQEARAADVAAPPRVVPEPVRPLRHVKQTDIRSHRLAGLAHLKRVFFDYLC